jgi:hypothetical protein
MRRGMRWLWLRDCGGTAFEAAVEAPLAPEQSLVAFQTSPPLLLLLYAALALLGGALYAPANVDALTYRLPRVLYWLAEQRWHWIATNDPRMNISPSGFEWLMAPVVASREATGLSF